MPCVEPQTLAEERGVKLLIKKKHVTCYCDFCGKSDDEVAKMVDGKHAFICGDCVDAASALIRRKLALVGQT